MSVDCIRGISERAILSSAAFILLSVPLFGVAMADELSKVTLPYALMR